MLPGREGSAASHRLACLFAERMSHSQIAARPRASPPACADSRGSAGTRCRLQPWQPRTRTSPCHWADAVPAEGTTAPQRHMGSAQDGECCGARRRPGQELARGNIRGLGQSLRQQPCRGSVGNLRGMGPGELSSAGHCREGLGWLPQSLRKRFWRVGPGNGASGEGAATPPHTDSQRLPMSWHSALGSARHCQHSARGTTPPSLCSHQHLPHAEVCGAAWGTLWHPRPPAASEPCASGGPVQGRSQGAHSATPQAQGCLLPRTRRHWGHHSHTRTSQSLQQPREGHVPQPCSPQPHGEPQHPAAAHHSPGPAGSTWLRWPGRGVGSGRSPGLSHGFLCEP